MAAKKYYFVYVLIRLTSLVCIGQNTKEMLLASEAKVSLISTKTKEYIFGLHLCIRSTKQN